MNEVDVKTEGDLKTVKFARTPKMSTYLAAVVVGMLDSVEGTVLFVSTFSFFERDSDIWEYLYVCVCVCI